MVYLICWACDTAISHPSASKKLCSAAEWTSDNILFMFHNVKFYFNTFHKETRGKKQNRASNNSYSPKMYLNDQETLAICALLTDYLSFPGQ